MAAQTRPAVPAHAFAVLIGVEDYSASGLNQLRYASKDTDLFQHHLISPRGSLGKDSKDPKEIQEFVTPGASGAAKNLILQALSQIISQQAGSNDVVYIFITARTEVPLQSNEIFIDVAKSSREKKDSEISLSEIRGILQLKRETRKVIFAELSGNQAAGVVDRGVTKIGDRVKHLLTVDNLSGVVVAESDSQAPDTVASNGGHRVFPYLLVSGLQAPTGQFEGFRVDQDSDHLISFAEIRNFLEKYFPEYTRRLNLNRGVVQRFGDQKASDVFLSDLTKPGLAELAWKPAHSSSVLAASSPFAGLGFAFSDIPGQDQLPPEIKPVLDRFSAQLQLENLTGPGGARELLDQMRNSGADSKLLEERTGLLVAALRDQAQEQITRYGIGDRFTIDPKWAETEASSQEYQKAVDAFRAILELDPNVDKSQINARVDFCLGRIAMITKDPTASSKFASAAKLDPNFAEPLNALGVLDFQKANFREALGNFKDATANADLWAYPRHNAALAYVELGRYDDALDEYRRAIQKAPYYPYLHYNLGVLLQRLNRLREAEVEYKVSLDLFNKEADQTKVRAQAWLAAHNRDESERAVLESQLLRRNIAAVYVAEGSLAEQRKDAKGAADAYKEALAHDSDSIAAKQNLALLQKEESHDLNAIASLLEENLEEDAGYEPSQLALADTYLRLGRFADAEQIYSKIGSGNLSAIAGWAKALAGQGRTGEAIALVEPVVRKQHAAGFVSPELAVTLGDLYQTLGDSHGACDQFRSAIKSLSELPEEDALEKSAKGRLKRCKTIIRNP